MKRSKPRLAPEAVSLPLKALYDAIAAEPVPQSMHDLIGKAK